MHGTIAVVLLEHQGSFKDTEAYRGPLYWPDKHPPEIVILNDRKVFKLATSIEGPVLYNNAYAYYNTTGAALTHNVKGFY